MGKFFGLAVVLAVLLQGVSPAVLCAQEKAAERAVTGGGMTVLVQEADDDLVAACLFIKVGGADEDASNNGITSLMNHVVLSCRSSSGAQATPALAVERLGGKLSVETTGDFSCFRLVAPSAFFAPALKALGEAISGAACTDSALSMEKDALAARDDWSDDRITRRAYRIFLKKTYAGRPYGLDPDGLPGSINRLTRADIDSWRAAYYRPDNMLLSVCGRVSGPGTVKSAEDAFKGPWPTGAAARKARPAPLGGDVAEKKTFTQDTPEGGAVAVLGFTAPAPGSRDYPSVMVIDALLAQGLGSSIYRDLRGARGLAYSFGSYMRPTKESPRLAFYVETDPASLDASVQGIRESVMAVRQGSFTDDDLARAKARLLGGMSLTGSTALERAWDAGWGELFGLGPDYTERLERQIEGQGRSDVTRAADRYMDDYTLVLLRPRQAARR